jgi:hypothetical protein
MTENIWEERPDTNLRDYEIRHNAQIYSMDNRIFNRKSLINNVQPLVISKYVIMKPRLKELHNTIPILINQRGQLVCIPLTDDEPNMGIFGQKGKGKTVMYLNILSNAYWNCGIRCGIISDETMESLSWTRPNEADNFIPKLKVLGQKPTGLPIVGLLPNFRDVIMPKTKTCPIINISINWQEFLEHPIKLKDLGNSQEYFESSVKPLLKNCKNIKEILQMIELVTIRNAQKEKFMGMSKEDIQEKMKQINVSGGLPSLTSNKLKNILKSWYDKQLFDISCNAPSKITLSTPHNTYTDLEPFSALLLANLIPVMFTSQIRQEECFESYFNNFNEKIYYGQTKVGQPFHDNKLTIWLFCDEMNNLPKDSEIIKTMFRIGRPNRIGFVWSTQEPEKLNDTIISQTKYFIIFKSGDKELKVLDSFNFSDEHKKRIFSQQEFQACIVSNDPVLIYDAKKNKVFKESVRDKPQFGGIVFPTANPRSPKEGRIKGVTI